MIHVELFENELDCDPIHSFYCETCPPYHPGHEIYTHVENRDKETFDAEDLDGHYLISKVIHHSRKTYAGSIQDKQFVALIVTKIV